MNRAQGLIVSRKQLLKMSKISNRSMDDINRQSSGSPRRKNDMHSQIKDVQKLALKNRKKMEEVNDQIQRMSPQRDDKSRQPYGVMIRSSTCDSTAVKNCQTDIQKAMKLTKSKVLQLSNSIFKQLQSSSSSSSVTSQSSVKSRDSSTLQPSK